MNTHFDRLTKNVGQLAQREYALIAGAVLKAAPCNFLVFGMGMDSELWAELNSGGKTVFLENDPQWYRSIPNGLSYFVSYPNLKAPLLVTRHAWDVIFVDSPTGFEPPPICPGREESIALASKVVAKQGIIFCHDIDRTGEIEYSKRYLGQPQFVLDKLGVFYGNGKR